MLKNIEGSWNKSAEGYDYLIQKQLGSYRQVTSWSAILEKLIGRPPKRVLEIGCGPGFLSILMSRLGHQVKAVDGSENMLSIARHNFEANGVRVETQLEDGVLLPEEKEGSFDVIISRDVVWNLYEPDTAMARWKEVLRPGGKVIYFDGDYRYAYNNRRPLWKWFSKALQVVIDYDHPDREKNTKEEDNVFLLLPLVRKARPAEDRDMLTRAGFVKIRILPDRFRNSIFSRDFWTYGYQGKKFIAVAWKGNGNA